MTVKIGFFDIETEVHRSFGWNIGNPHDLRNDIICWALSCKDKVNTGGYYLDSDFDGYLEYVVTRCDMLVCHNAKFDILFMWIRYRWFRDWVTEGGRIWCTMLAEHIISGQREPYMSLNRAATKYGGWLKDDRIKDDFWDKGFMTKDIPKEMLMNYNMDDTRNDEIVFEKQLELLRKQGQLELAKLHMEDLLFIILAEANGLYVNMDNAKAAYREHKEKAFAFEQKILDSLQTLIPDVPREMWNINSPDQKSIIFFGGVKKFKEKGPILDANGEPERVKTKSSVNYGEIKTKLYDREIVTKGLGLIPLPEWKKAKQGVFTVNEKVISLLSQRCEIAKLMLSYTRLVTIMNKYLVKILDLTYEKDSCVHARFTIDQKSGRAGAKNPPIVTIPRE